MEIKELRDEIVPRLDEFNLRLGELENFRASVIAGGGVVVLVIANAATWVAVVR